MSYRARVRHRANPAERQSQFGHPETACATWHKALEDRKNAAARELYGRARTVGSQLESA